MSYRECPRCRRGGQFKAFGGKRPGWECPSCGLFFPADTWKPEGDTFVRKYPKPKKRSTYVNKDALAGGTGAKLHVQDEWDILDPDRVEKDLPDLSNW